MIRYHAFQYNMIEFNIMRPVCFGCFLKCACCLGHGLCVDSLDRLGPHEVSCQDTQAFPDLCSGDNGYPPSC